MYILIRRRWKRTATICLLLSSCDGPVFIFRLILSVHATRMFFPPYLSRLYLKLALLLCPILIYYYCSTSWVSSKPNTVLINASVRTGRIMYVIRTSSYFYQKRLVYLLQTWIDLVADDVFYVSDTPISNISDHHLLLTQVACGHDAHSMSTLCCKTAHDFLLFHRHRSRYEWFCHFDDDQYVHTTNLQKYLATLNSNDPYYIGRNSWPETLKRSKEPYPQPFWFATLGAGVCFSRRLIDLLEPYTREISSFVNGCLEENYHDDIYLGFLISSHLNVTLTIDKRFHSHLEDDLYNDKQTFLRLFTEQITFGFRLPNRIPAFLPNLYPPETDPYRMRTLHCLLYPHVLTCQSRLREHLLNGTR